MSADQRATVIKVVLAGPSDSGKLAILRLLATRRGVASLQEYPVGELRIFRTEWTEALPENRRLVISVHSLTGMAPYNAAEELLTRDADGIIFVADPSPDQLGTTWNSLLSLSENTRRNGYELRSVALALQYHQNGAQPALSPAVMDERLGVPAGIIPRFVSTPGGGDAESEAFDSVLAQILDRLQA